VLGFAREQRADVASQDCAGSQLSLEQKQLRIIIPVHYPNNNNQLLPEKLLFQPESRRRSMEMRSV
jgi:hypothetical protein